MNRTDADVIVVGGGISGLAVAWNLQRGGASVIVLEAAARAGGTIGSAREHGCLIEAGPSSTLDTTPLISALLEEVGIAGERIAPHPAARKRFILRGGSLIPLPLSPFSFLASPLFSTTAKLRLLTEPFIGRGPQDVDESVAAFVRRRLGAEFLDYAVNPFVAGVYAGDVETLSLRAAFPRLFDLEQTYGSLLGGQLLGALKRARNQEKSKKAAPMLSFRNGMQTLTDAIAQRLARIELGCEVTSILPRRGGFDIDVDPISAGERASFRAHAVVLATPAHAATKLTAPFASHAAAALAAVPYAPVAVVTSVYRRAAIAHALDGFGFLVPQCEQRRTLGTIFASSLYAERAPPDLALLTTFVGGLRQPALAQLPESELTASVQSELAALLGAPARAEWAGITRWALAIPQYTQGHLERIACIERAESDLPGLFFCANYRGGISVGDCIKSADNAANRVSAYIRGSANSAT
jgi:protoporphyrinogen/coproporphyrinogen III oxidase